ncbi:MAG: PLP-dependent transferase, partial [Actinomycetota bacterium]
MRDETLAIHAGYETEPTTKSVAVPIYQTVAYEFDNAKHGADRFDLAVPSIISTRIRDPTHPVLRERLAAREGGVEVTVPAGTTWADLDIPQLLARGGEHGVVVARGLAPQPADR